MARYLVVAHQTATSPLLLRRAAEVATDDPDAVFTLLIPETHIGHRFTCDEIETREVAHRRGAEAREAFEGQGLRVAGVVVGDPSPVLAIEDELRNREGAYDAIILSTLPGRSSRWLRLDVPERVASKFSLPVFHVVEGGDRTWAATEPVRGALARGRQPVLPPRRAPSPRRILAGPSLYAIVLALLAVHLVVTTVLITEARGFPTGVVLLLVALVLAGSAILGERSSARTR